jgi:hypothetical protein
MSTGIRRKVLRREDLGLCICWPKAHWGHLPVPGATAAVRIDGQPVSVMVYGERCNCRGNGWHEHRFLGLPETAGLAVGARVSVGVGEEPVTPARVLTVSDAIAETDAAWLFGRPLPASRRRVLGLFLGQQQGLPGCYHTLFAPVGDELAAGYRVPTGERIPAGGGARHVLGEEALRALVLIGRAEPVGNQHALCAETVARAAAGMDELLTRHEARPSGSGRGMYCCRRCSVALWRVLAVGGLPAAEERLACGLRTLNSRRDGTGAWRGFPFYYTLSALLDAEIGEAAAELAYARPLVERRLASGRHDDEDPFSRRRQRVLERVLAR